MIIGYTINLVKNVNPYALKSFLAIDAFSSNFTLLKNFNIH